MIVLTKNSCILVLSILLWILCEGAEPETSSSHKISKRCFSYKYTKGDCTVSCKGWLIKRCHEICAENHEPEKKIPKPIKTPPSKFLIVRVGKIVSSILSKILSEEAEPETSSSHEISKKPEHHKPEKPTKTPAKPSKLRVSEAKCLEFIENLPRKWYGIRKKRSSLILAGRPTYVDNPEYTHLGAIGWKAINSWIFKCGASLISSKFVLTAAHCTQSPPDDEILDRVPKIVRLGDNYIGDLEIDVRLLKEAQRVDVNILRIIVHTKYDPSKEYRDIALMELEHDVKFNEFIQPACLWSHHDFVYKEAIITGWGSDVDIQAATVDIIDRDTCDKLLKPWCTISWCGTKHQICAGKLDGSVGVCYGDSGTPLQVKMDLLKGPYYPSMYYVLGVTATGFGCLEPNTPSVFTKVSSYIGWIERNVWP